MKKNLKEVRIAAVILAAGRSTRFGSNKLLRVLRGKPVIEWSFDSLARIDFWKIVIVTNDSGQLDPFIREDVEKLVNKRYKDGIGTSIALATKFLGKEVNGILFLLGDQPLVGPDNIEKLVVKFLEAPEKVVAFSTEGIVRNPMIFPSTFFYELTELKGDKGARDIALAHDDALSRMEIDPTRLLDLDDVDDVPIIEGYLEKYEHEWLVD
jgi:molybdenum cofactor cytidylyltransferase